MFCNKTPNKVTSSVVGLSSSKAKKLTSKVKMKNQQVQMRKINETSPTKNNDKSNNNEHIAIMNNAISNVIDLKKEVNSNSPDCMTKSSALLVQKETTSNSRKKGASKTRKGKQLIFKGCQSLKRKLAVKLKSVRSVKQAPKKNLNSSRTSTSNDVG